MPSRPCARPREPPLHPSLASARRQRGAHSPFIRDSFNFAQISSQWKLINKEEKYNIFSLHRLPPPFSSPWRPISFYSAPFAYLHSLPLPPSVASFLLLIHSRAPCPDRPSLPSSERVISRDVAACPGIVDGGRSQRGVGARAGVGGEFSPIGRLTARYPRGPPPLLSREGEKERERARETRDREGKICEVPRG